MLEYKTKAAAAYLTTRGVTTSKSYLEKIRLRGPEDDRDRGPDWTRDEHGTCWYSAHALDQYAASRLSRRAPRAPAAQPPQFRRHATEADAT